MTDFKMTKDFILVKAPPEIPLTTSFGLILPTDNKSVFVQTAEVLAIGPGKYLDEKRKKYRATTVKPGQTIAFGKSVAKKQKINGEWYLILKENDIIGVVQ